MNDLIRGSFGQLAPIGTLYNVKSDSFLDASLLRHGQHLDAVVSLAINTSKVTHNASAKYESRLEPLGVSHDTAASILSGAVEAKGSSDYLQAEFDSTSSLHGAYHCTFTTVADVLDLKRVNLREHIDPMPLQTRDSTHVVTGITWGMRSTFVINHEFPGHSAGPQVERAFCRDLNRLKAFAQSITGHAESNSHEESPLELAYTFHVYSDPTNEGLQMRGLDEMRKFIRLRLGELPQTNQGKGCPLSYTLLPIDKLDRHIPGFQSIIVTPIPLPIEDFTEFMGLFDEFASCKKRLGSYYKSLLEKRPYVSEEHIRVVYMSIRQLNEWKTHLQKRLVPLLRDIRTGITAPQYLHGLYIVVGAEAGSPRHVAPLIGQETEKLLFLTKAVAAGAVYIGHGGSPLEKIKTPGNDPSCYAMLLNTVATQQKITWNHQCSSLMRLLGQSTRDKPIYVVDCDAPSCRVELGDARVVEYQTGRDLVTALVWEYPAAPPETFDQGTQVEWDTNRNEEIPVSPENIPRWHFPAAAGIGDNGDTEDAEDTQELETPSESCLARYVPGSLKTTDHSNTEEGTKPMDRRFVKVPCPGIHCDRKTPREWVCFQCFMPLEFGVTDEFIYCDCGHGLYSSYDFKCNSESHGPGFDRFPSDSLLVMLRSLKSLKSDSINILILGETGVGKSTFINGLANYLTYDTLDEAKAAKELTVLIPCSFSTQIMNRDGPGEEIEEHFIHAGTSRNDERDSVEGQSATQQTNVYPITIGTTTYRLFDTPGIGDTRGAQYDKENMTDMMKTLSDYDVLHGILILLKPNSSRLNVSFKFCIKELLTHLHRSAVSNIVFGFTNTRTSNYTPGDTYGPLKKLLEEYRNLGLSLNKKNIYCFDSESFRYLAAHFMDVPLQNEDDMRKSWQRSKEESEKLVEYIKKLNPHNVNSTLSMNGARQQVVQLMRPISEISHRISISLAVVEQNIEYLKDTRLERDRLLGKLHLEVSIPKVRKLAKPRTVCNAPKCCDTKEVSNGDRVKLHKKICHEDCTLPNVKQDVLADPAIMKCRAFNRGESTKCNQCGCPWQKHMHILYLVQTVTEKIRDEEVECMIQQNESALAIQKQAINNAQKMVDEYKYELTKMQEARAWFVVFLTKNAMAPINDTTVEYLDMLIQDELNNIEAGESLGLPVDKNKETLTALRKDRQAHLDLVEAFKVNTQEFGGQQLTEKGIDDLVKSLYNLKHFGKDLKSLENTITSSHRATYRERPFRVPRPGTRQAPLGPFDKRPSGEGAVVVHGGKHESRRKRGGQGFGGWLPSLTRK
ncbi:hypothetical protein N0V84_001823 [Fusarium piperis]|uniref:G domain-containing protein n=1 Tax=Fusarium piperis TaxID=1435070 RepID=A0A9W8WKQ0_9HYPO|nr:hypothetical protein N0V84_001823 [Fusarium piperis]